MKVITPLAGPAFEGPYGGTKAEIVLSGTPLLRAALESRPWWRSGAVADADHVFVLREGAASRRFATGPLAAWYPRARSVFLSAATGGAALSALAGLALLADSGEPLCIDLADILYDTPANAEFGFGAAEGGVALVFFSDNPAYSYLRTDSAGRVVEAAEKRVISTHASAGTYLFRSAAVLLRALAHNLDHAEAVTHRGLFFVCPLFNGVLAQGLEVRLQPVAAVQDIKLMPG